MIFRDAIEGGGRRQQNFGAIAVAPPKLSGVN